MKVCLVGPGEECIGGVSTYIRQVRKYSKLDIVFVPIKSVCAKGGFLIKLSLLIGIYFKFLFILLFGRIDLIHINPSLARHSIIRDSIFTFLAKIFGKDVLIQWHGWNPDNQNLLFRYNWLLKFTFWNSMQMNVLNPAAIEVLRVAGFKNEIYCTRTFVDDDFLDKGSFEQKRGVKTILFLSTVSKNKGIYEAIETFRMLSLEMPELRLVVAGDGPELELIKGTINPDLQEKITFTGYVTGNDKIQVFKQSDIYLFPSFYEGMPISLLEAMGCGLPIVCSSVGAIPYFFVDQKMGFIVSAHSAKDYFEKIKYLINNPKKVAEISKYNSRYIIDNHLASAQVAKLDISYQLIHSEE